MLYQNYYDAVVVSDEVDPNHAGAVRVKIIGITDGDGFNDKDQPWVLPVVSSFMAVPTKGTYLRVEFEDGDIHRGRYTHTSAELSYLPEEYVSQYPNVAVMNLGSDLFHMTHYRDSKETVIKHDSSSRLRWDGLGRITHDSDLAYQNAGYGAKNGTGTKIQAVLTGGTVDVFCCTPYSSSQGSEYLWVSHVSRATVEGPAPANPDTTDVTVLEVGQTRPLGAGKVDYTESPSKTPVASRDVTNIIITNSGGFNFISVYNDVMDKSKNISYHYVIGTAAADSLADKNSAANALAGTPDAGTGSGSSRGANEDSSPKGFMQFVELTNMAAFGSNTDSDGVKVNANCVSVCLIGTGELTKPYSDYQYQKLNDIIAHVKAEYGDNVTAVPASDSPFDPEIDLGSFEYERLS